MLAQDKPEIVAILNWELSTLGYPIADLAYCCLPCHLPSDVAGMRGVVGEDLTVLGIPDEQAIIECYCQQFGHSGTNDWHVFLVFSLFRLAATLQGAYARALQGNASSADTLQVGERAHVLAEAGWRIAKQGKHGIES